MQYATIVCDDTMLHCTQIKMHDKKNDSFFGSCNENIFLICFEFWIHLAYMVVMKKPHIRRFRDINTIMDKNTMYIIIIIIFFISNWFQSDCSSFNLSMDLSQNLKTSKGKNSVMLRPDHKLQNIRQYHPSPIQYHVLISFTKTPKSLYSEQLCAGVRIIDRNLQIW